VRSSTIHPLNMDATLTCTSLETAGTVDQSSSAADDFSPAQETTLQQKLEETRQEAKRLAEGESLVFRASESCVCRLAFDTRLITSCRVRSSQGQRTIPVCVRCRITRSRSRSIVVVGYGRSHAILHIVFGYCSDATSALQHRPCRHGGVVIGRERA
jgi:hypothetical protein